MRLMGMTVILILLQLGVIIFHGLPVDNMEINPYKNSTILSSVPLIGDSLTDGFSLWDLILNPSSSVSGAWFAWILLVMGSTAIIGFGVSLFTGLKSDLLWLFPVFIFFLAFGFIIIFNVYNLVTSEIGLFCPATMTMPCFPASLVAFFITGLLSISWVYCCMELWTGKQLT